MLRAAGQYPDVSLRVSADVLGMVTMAGVDSLWLGGFFFCAVRIFRSGHLLISGGCHERAISHVGENNHDDSEAFAVDIIWVKGCGRCMAQPWAKSTPSEASFCRMESFSTNSAMVWMPAM